MGIGRLIVLGLIVWVVWLIFKRLKSLPKNPNVSQKKSTKISKVRQCAECSVHIPENEAIKKGHLFYCCKMHADKNQ